MRSSWILAGVGLLAFAVLVWFAGPLLVVAGQAPLAAPALRLAVILAFFLQYLSLKFWGLRQARRNNERIVAELTPAADSDGSAEAAQLRQRFAAALAALRRTRFSALRPFSFGRSYLYQLPWYMILGAPGAGKTTALLNSGLDFPLAQQLGRDPVAGFGGTRNCDWWFTDRAVLIDTAGRYTTQDSDRVADRQAWELFLQLLRRARPRRPLDGVLVAVSAGDLLQFSAAQRNDHARTLRARLDELERTLARRLPVYVVITKCDLLPGFMEWFDGLARAERDQVWGVTFTSGTAAGFAGSFEPLVARLTDGLLTRLHAERDAQRRARIFSLPGALRALGEPLDALVSDAFGAGSAPEDTATLLRGVYLTSGTQAGTPIDRMLLALGRELGLERQILPPNQATGKSFFLSGPLRDVVLADVATGGGTPARRRPRLLLAASVLLLQLCAVALGVSWVRGYVQASREIAALEQQVDSVGARIAALPATVDPDPRPLLPALEALLALRNAPVWTRGSWQVIDLGAASRRQLAAAVGGAYERILLGPFQQKIARAIDASMRAGADINVQYEALKAHEMLTNPAHFDAAALNVFVLSYWDSALTPPMNAAERAALAAHLRALLEAGAVGSGVDPDRLLVDSVRNRLNSRSGAQRIALRLALLANSHPSPDFTLASAVPAAAALLVAGDGHSAPDPVAGRYTLAAYRDFVSREVPTLAAQLTAEAPWVLGAATTNAATDAADFLASYRLDYAQAWTHWIDDLHLKPTASNAEALQQARSLGDPYGPLPPLVDALARQTRLRLDDGSPGPIAPQDPTAERFVQLTALAVHDEQGGTTLEGPLLWFRELRALRALPADGASDAQAAAAADRLARIIGDAKREPEPIRSWLLTLAVPAAGEPAAPEFHGSAAALSHQIAARLGVACIDLVAGRFPFDRRTERDASLQDFSRLFAPHMGFDDVFRKWLAPRVDTSGDTWQARTPVLGPSTDDLERFRAAARIRDVLFAQGGVQPALRLTFRPQDMDSEIDRFQLDIDGQTIRYAHGPEVPTTVRWPGPEAGHVRLETIPAGGAVVDYRGAWALFRLMDHTAIQDAGTQGHFRVVFDVDGRHVSFDVESNSGANPFRLRELEHFDCPLLGR